jgi:hypothetical protein
MTGGILLVAGWYLVTAAGLTGARASARGLLTVAAALRRARTPDVSTRPVQGQ